MPGRVLVFLACSLDGFIAGPDDDLSWLPEPAPAPDDFGYAAFMATVGALLMGRNTFDVVDGFPGDWPYAALPVRVATSRELAPPTPTVRAVKGSIAELIAEGLAAAEGRDLYLDGGALIRQALDAGLVDELTLTLVPVVLGTGRPLFAGTTARHSLELLEHRALGQGVVQLRYRPRRASPGTHA